MGTPLREVIDAIGGGARAGPAASSAVMHGVAAALIPADQLDTPLSYEGMAAVGSGLGSAGFIVFDDATTSRPSRPGASRFLAVESCGQCTPCKQDGMTISDALAPSTEIGGAETDLDSIATSSRPITDGARCSLATQHQVVIGSIINRFGEEILADVAQTREGAEAVAVAPLSVLNERGAVLDADAFRKQPDWTFADTWSGKFPADLLADHLAQRKLQP